MFSEFDQPDDNSVVGRFKRGLAAAGSRLERYEEYDARYEGAYEVPSLALRLQEGVRPFESTVNFCRLTVDSIANRQTITGFITSIDEARKATLAAGQTLDDLDSVDKKVWDWWQHADMDKESRLAHVEALLQGCAYVIVNFPEGVDKPEFIVASAASMFAMYDPRTREIEEAYQWFSDSPFGDTTPNAGVVYTKNEIIPVRRDAKSGDDWYIDPAREIETHNLGIVPVAAIVNRARIGDRYGRSEITDVIPLSDFTTRLLTQAQVAMEFLGTPFRYAAGVNKEDFVDAEGRTTNKLQVYMSTFVALAEETAKFGQLPAAELRNFTDAFNMLAKQISAVTALPPHALGLTTSNPASADAIRSGEANLVQRILDRCSAFEQGWERAIRIALIWEGGEHSEDARSMRIETTWANPETPTFSAKADAVVKLRSAKVISNIQALEDLGYSPEQIIKIEDLLRQEREQALGWQWDQIDQGALANEVGNSVPPPTDETGGRPPGFD